MSILKSALTEGMPALLSGFPQGMPPLLLLVGVGMVAVLVMVLLGKAGGSYPYKQAERLLTKAESRFMWALEKAVPREHRVFAKIRVADALVVKDGLSRSRWFKAFNKISSKHFDFAVCDARSHKVLCVIELNDKSHARKDRQESDAFKRKACSAAGLPMLEIAVQRYYETDILAKQLKEAMQPNK